VALNSLPWFYSCDGSETHAVAVLASKFYITHGAYSSGCLTFPLHFARFGYCLANHVLSVSVLRLIRLANCMWHKPQEFVNRGMRHLYSWVSFDSIRGILRSLGVFGLFGSGFLHGSLRFCNFCRLCSAFQRYLLLRGLTRYSMQNRCWTSSRNCVAAKHADLSIGHLDADTLLRVYINKKYAYVAVNKPYAFMFFLYYAKRLRCPQWDNMASFFCEFVCFNHIESTRRPVCLSAQHCCILYSLATSCRRYCRGRRYSTALFAPRWSFASYL